jgi:hypothetical protein
MPFFVALVVSYMLKDRIKELGRYYFAHKLGKNYYDHKTKLPLIIGLEAGVKRRWTLLMKIKYLWKC